MTNAIIASTSTIFGGNYLEYLLLDIEKIFANATTVLFIPFARPSGISHEEYTQRVALAFKKINKKVIGLQEFNNLSDAIQKAEAIFVGGGNTFLLVKQLHDNNLMTVLSNAIKSGIPYLGCSAGSNITGISMQTTNDMPIVYPSSFETLGVIPFNLNPHYLDPDINSTHKGETRETRIIEFHSFNEIPVIGLREGSWLEVIGNKVTLKGNLKARFFEQNRKPIELESGFEF